MNFEKILEYLLMQQILDNPLPWRVERVRTYGIMTYDVITSNRHTIAKFDSLEEAMEISRMAQRICDEHGLLIF